MTEPLRLPKRRHRRPRCPVCMLHTDLCVCAHLPRVRTQVRWVIVQHASDALRPTSTGRLAAGMLSPAVLSVYGQRAKSFDAHALKLHPNRAWLLFPSDDAETLTAEWWLEHQPKQLVLLDGTWRQASRMSHRVPLIRDLPRLRLPPGDPSSWSIRCADRPDRLCTVETAIRVVAIIGDVASAREMWVTMKWIEARLLYMKGRAPYPIDREELRQHLILPEWLKAAPANGQVRPFSGSAAS